MGWFEKNGENKKERYNKRNLRSGYFSGLEKLGKEYVDIGVEDFSKGNKFRYLDVHTVGFQLGISAFGHRNPYLHRRFFPGMCVDGRLKYFSANVRRNWHWTAIRYALHRESKGTGRFCSFETGYHEICDTIQLEKYRYLFQCAKESNDFDSFMKFAV